MEDQMAMIQEQINKQVDVINSQAVTTSVVTIVVAILIAVGVYLISKNFAGAIILGYASMIAGAVEVTSSYNKLMENFGEKLAQVPEEFAINIVNPWFIIAIGVILLVIIVLVIKIIMDNVGSKSSATAPKFGQQSAPKQDESVNYASKTKRIKSRKINLVK